MAHWVQCGTVSAHSAASHMHIDSEWGGKCGTLCITCNAREHACTYKGRQSCIFLCVTECERWSSGPCATGDSFVLKNVSAGLYISANDCQPLAPWPALRDTPSGRNMTQIHTERKTSHPPGCLTLSLFHAHTHTLGLTHRYSHATHTHTHNWLMVLLVLQLQCLTPLRGTEESMRFSWIDLNF